MKSNFLTLPFLTAIPFVDALPVIGQIITVLVGASAFALNVQSYFRNRKTVK